ncbi:hypothetical protein J4422_03835 [Candidatus Pacearchaeota archaeon]|nr:hypothetical protein [Candidatus Pacearchaeota archaeon]
MSIEKNMNAKAFLMIAVLTASLVLTLSFAGAEFWACADYKQVINYCNNYKPSKTCDSPNGCTYCMSKYNETTNCYVHGVWPKCNQIPQECSDIGGGGGGIDAEPPVLTVNNPVEDGIYNSRVVLLDLSVNEESDIHYLDLINGRGRWTPVCSNCFGYERTRSFREGLNELRFRAVDVVGNIAYVDVSFFIDSDKPRILKTEPGRGFTNGDFLIQFKEENPTSLDITFGDTNPGFNTYEVDIDSECQLDENNGKYYCDTHIDLSAYDGNEILYWANLTDTADNKANPRRQNVLTVDTTLPVINSLIHTINKKYVTFRADITEENFEEMTYSYTDTNGRLREGRMCSRLKDGICEKKLSFKTGHFDVSIQVIDEAGNSVGQVVSFDIV